MYIGKFILPSGNAAVLRAQGVCRALNSLGIETKLADTQNYREHFSYCDTVICYNLHAAMLSKFIRLCKKHGKRLIIDRTEWYSYKNPLKAIDETIVMHFLNKHADSMITVSSFLCNYYNKYMPIAVIPPLFESKPDKSKQSEPVKKLVFAGSISAKKEALGDTVTALCQTDCDFTLDILGTNAKEFEKVYGYKPDDNRINFVGKVPHKTAQEYISSSDYMLVIRKKSRLTDAGFASKLCESISLGTAVITTDVGDTSKYVAGKNGHIIDINNLKKEFERVLRLPLPTVESETFSPNAFATELAKLVKPRVLVSLKEGGQNGGPFVSHRRIMDSSLSEKFEFIPLCVPRARKLLSPLGYREFVRKIKSARPDFVLAAGLSLDGFLTTRACKSAKVKSLVAVHGSAGEALDCSSFKKHLLTCLEKRTIRMADGVFAVSDYVNGWDILKKARKNYGRVYNLAPLPDVKTDARAKYSIPSNAVVALSTGRITRDKGYDLLADVILNTDIHYIIAGDGEYLDTLRQQINQGGAGHRVTFTGYLDDACSLYAAADIFIICSRHETLCNSVIEAAVYGVPSVATDIGGLRESVQSGNTGILVPTDDTDAFAGAVNTLASDREYRQKLSQNAKKYAADKFDRETTIGLLDGIFTDITGVN